MLDQIGPCSTLELLQSVFKERSQFWRGMDRHGDEGTWLVVENRWREGGRKNTAYEALGILVSQLTSAASMLPNWDNRCAVL